jgi:hypothetical protein
VSSRPRACALCVIRVETDQNDSVRVTAAWTHDVETWLTSSVRRELSLEQVPAVVREFLATYVEG